MVIQALKKVFRKPPYVFLALILSVAAFVSVVWLPNFRLIVSIISSPNTPFLSKIALPISLLGSIVTNFTLFSAFYAIAIAVLFGIYAAMMVYSLKHRVERNRQSGIAVGFLGVGSGVLGVGCAACGSFLITSILPLVGVGGVLASLPLGGNKFGVLGVILLVVSIYMVAKQIQTSFICKIN